MGLGRSRVSMSGLLLRLLECPAAGDIIRQGTKGKKKAHKAVSSV